MVLVLEIGLFEVWRLLGALLAALVLASSVVALPMPVVIPVSVMAAVKASWRAVANHLAATVAWAVLIALLVGLGMLGALLCLIVIARLIAYASWRAYRDLTSTLATGASPRQDLLIQTTLFGRTKAQIARSGLTFGVGALVLHMLFIVRNLALESEAGTVGTFILFLVLSFGMLDFLAKNLSQWMLDI